LLKEPLMAEFGFFILQKTGTTSHNPGHFCGNQIRGPLREEYENKCSQLGASKFYKSLALEQEKIVYNYGNISYLPTKG